MPQKIVSSSRSSTSVLFWLLTWSLTVSHQSTVTANDIDFFQLEPPSPNGLLPISSTSEHSTQPLTHQQIQFLREIVDSGLNASDYLFTVLEPQLYHQGQIITKNDPAAGVAAFNYQEEHTKELARYGYATLKASALLRQKLSLNRKQVNALSRVSLRQTNLHKECPLRSETIECPAFSRLYRTGDGSCNNLQHREWGASFRPFQRFLPAAYNDGIEEFRISVAGKPLPSPRTVSALIHRHMNVTANQFTTMVMQWGQFLDHDITSSSQTRGFNGSIPKCCLTDGRGQLPIEKRHPDCLPIQVASDDPFYRSYNLTCLEFVRSSPAPHEDCALGTRDQINQITSFVDGSNIYGSTDKYLSSLRLYKGGKLKYKDMLFRKSLLPVLDHPLENECRTTSKNMHCFKGGDTRTNEQPGLAAIHTVWMREHNRLVTRLSTLNPHWNDERLFHEARKIVGAQLQHISYNEWLPLILGERVVEVFELRLKRRGYYFGYNETVNPTAANAFGAAAFRFGHSLVPNRLNRCNRHHQSIPFETPLRRELMDPTPVHNIGAVDRLMLGMCSQPAMRRDEFIVEELTNHLFETPDKPFGMDLMSLNIQRARDHGIPPYTAWREACGLTPIRNWGQLLSIMDDDTVGRLRIAYESVDDIDLFPGGMSEKPVIGGIVGPTFACIIAQQFLNLRQGDRFWYENGDQPSSFTESQLREIRRITLSRIICDNLDDIETLQPWIMLLPDERTNPRVSCRGGSIPHMDLKAWMETQVKATIMHGPINDPKNQLKPISSSHYHHIVEQEELESRRMPLPEPEDDWVEELPRPIKKELDFNSAKSIPTKEDDRFKHVRTSAYNHHNLFYRRRL